MDKFEFGEGETDRQKLLHFVDTLESFLEQLISDAPNAMYFIPGFEESYQLAWSELQPSFQKLRLNTEDADIDNLKLHGLTGNQLAFKLKVINHFSNKFFDQAGILPTTIFPAVVKRILKKLMEAIDKFLASLIDAVGAGGAIAEYKDFLESIIDDDPEADFDEGYV